MNSPGFGGLKRPRVSLKSKLPLASVFNPPMEKNCVPANSHEEPSKNWMIYSVLGEPLNVPTTENDPPERAADINRGAFEEFRMGETTSETPKPLYCGTKVRLLLMLRPLIPAKNPFGRDDLT